jgi:hypothetical protein
VLINTPPFYGETTPAPDQRVGVGVDDRLMRQPRLLVPKRFPLFGVKISKDGLGNRCGIFGVLTSAWKHSLRTFFPVGMPPNLHPSFPYNSIQPGPTYSEFDGQGNQIQLFDLLPSNYANEAFSLALRISPDNITYTPRIFSDWNFGCRQFLLAFESDNCILLTGNSSTSQNSTLSVTAPATGSWVTLGFSAKAGDQRIYYDGRLVASGTGALHPTVTANTTGQDLYVLSNDCGAEWFALWYNKALTEAEHLSMHLNPYQFLIPA